MRERFKVGIVGTGHGVRTIAPALLSTDHFEIVAVSGSSTARAEVVANEHLPDANAVTFDQLLDMSELDLICVASPNEFHAEHMIAAANTECHLYLEKPVANSADEAVKVQQAMSRRSPDLLTIVGHQLRFNPFLRAIRKQWSDGAFGKVYSIVVRQRGGAFASPDRPWTWEFEKDRGGGVRLAMGTHLIDLVNFLSGRMPITASVIMDPVHELRRPNGSETERVVDVSNFFSASLDYDCFEGYVTTSAASHGPGMFEIEILGSKGCLYFDGLGNPSYFVEGALQPKWFTEAQIAQYQNRPGSSIFRKSLSVLAEEISKSLSGKDSSIGDAASVDDGVQLLQILDKAMKDYNLKKSQRSKMF
ncbi:Gfo/Idh/MocA family protein [Roseibium litorale]|uniref:Gfo/Idh/MocA family oxidoreductase n=1 Tax=Roseibium litorale TaxID=2803841 RepID=A0ABR9CVB4_9HYPH|nr:Gfo/Idh/MocA family oxidoreductase [Roseibium litorale]MBD8894117.1 Gfo/Idh/MocA family oxidoreductase [Roseibium litorale]